MNESWFLFFRNVAYVMATLMLVKYYWFLLLAPWYGVKERRRKLRMYRRGTFHHYWPTFTVIVPAWNEEVGVLKTIESVVRNTYKQVEIIVIDDGSSDHTHRVVHDYIETLPIKHPKWKGKVRLFWQENRGKGHALNHAISQARGDVIVTIDADSVLDAQALARLREYFCDTTISAVVGNVKVSNNYSLIGFIQQLEYRFGFYFKRAHAVMGSEYIFGGACAAFRKQVFEALGPFDEQNKTEDIEMSMRLRSHGFACTYAENVMCLTEGASSVTGLINQRLRWKKGRFDTFLRYRRMFFSFESQHNKPLSWFVLPFAMLSEIQLLLEPLSIALLVAYSFVSLDFLSLALGVLFVFMIYLVNALFGHEGIRLRTLLLFPVSWPLFYILVWIEYVALLRSLGMVLRGRDIEWQKWQRKGVTEFRS